MNNKTITMDEANKLLDSTEVRMTFGKFNGLLIEDIPNHYLTWLLEDDWIEEHHEYLLEPLQKELKYRKEFNVYIES